MTVLHISYRLKTALAAMLCAALAGCGTFAGQPHTAPQAPLPAHPNAAQNTQAQAPAQAQAQAGAPLMQRPGATSQYRLDAGDELRVIVFGQENLSGTFRVDDGGAITMPLLPPLIVRGQTAHEAKRNIEQTLAQTLLRNPNVSVEVSAFRPFFILGEVNAPGQYPYVAGMTVETAVAIAGGYTYRANKSRARITRGTPATGGEFKTDTSAQIMPGDTVFIRERFF